MPAVVEIERDREKGEGVGRRERKRERGRDVGQRDVVLHNAAHSCARIARSGTIDGKVTKRRGERKGSRMACRVVPVNKTAKI